MAEDFNNENEEIEEEVRPLWEVTYWDGVEENIKQIHVFACCHICMVNEAELYLDEEVGEGN